MRVGPTDNGASRICGLPPTPDALLNVMNVATESLRHQRSRDEIGDLIRTVLKASNPRQDINGVPFCEASIAPARGEAQVLAIAGAEGARDRAYGHAPWEHRRCRCLS